MPGHLLAKSPRSEPSQLLPKEQIEKKGNRKANKRKERILASGSGSGEGAGGGVSSSTEPSLPAAEEEPGDRSEIERALDQLELAKIKEQKDRLAEQISPLIESEKARLVRRLWHHNLGELPSPSIRGILLNRRNIPIMSMPIESMLLAVNSNFLVFSVSSDDMMGQSFASLVPTVAAAESAIGLAIFVITFRVRGTIAVESINSIQGFIIFSRKSLGNTFKVTLDGRIQAIQEESQQFPNPNEVVPPESNEQQRLLRISLRICGTVVESLPMARCAPKCEKTVQALLCRNLNVKSATLPNATSSRRIRLQDDIAIKMHVLVGKRFCPRCSSKAERVEFIRESLVVLRMVRVGDSLKNKEFE
ncbi:hypothetical protein KY290_023140 [Solanum tuberosum]|uniref:ATP synthase protein MI25 n=1 Tax=Solanum tuberosum TaxID=4113 RepID=A0ABQ7V6G5_SOLTU|nr:hypothetical protein KY290_023140 [Solanum tuberosum]